MTNYTNTFRGDRTVSNTEAQPEDGYHVTEMHWHIPAAGDNVEQFVAIAAKRFADDMRATIKAHQ
jgi:hypothetical protein